MLIKMTHMKTAGILLMVLFTLTCAQTVKSTEAPIDPTTPTTEPSSSSIDPSTASSTTTSIPTIAPNTTTTPIPTTTSKTTRATTTVSPDTTTVSPDTTTVQPTPRPTPTPPEFRKWSYTDNTTNQTCVIVQLALQIDLTYTTADDKSATIFYNVPVNGTPVITGSCGNDSQSISIQWGPKSLESKMVLKFTSNRTTSVFSLSEIHLSINAAGEFSDAKADQIIELYDVRDNFTTPLDMSYHCNKVQSLQFTNAKDGTEIIANATVSHLQLEAFHKPQNDQFATGKDCEAIDTPDIVPIAVGCALAGLVVIVLIVYLIGRRRAQARGYLSM